MTKRRKFLQQSIGLGASLPFLGNLIKQFADSSEATGTIPTIMCSRGRDWGEKVLLPAWKKYQENGSILDAIEVGSNVVELDPNDTSVGYGGLPNELGVVQLDASIMYGPTHNCGSVASLENIKTPCSVARLVMERTDHMMMVGPGALNFAKMHGFQEENLLTERARKTWLEWKENLSDRDDYFPPADGNYHIGDRPRGTINVLGVDAKGDIAGITTTSGLFGKIPGRIGDSPIIGAGLYVDNAVGAAGGTGRGEEVIRTCGSFLVVEKMRMGMTAQQACEAVIERIIELNGGIKDVDTNVKMVAISKNGDIGCAAIMGSSEGPPKACYINASGVHVAEGKFYKEWSQD
jgi:N4-(beta-N-acetylglucosaminyl)-L-asparaginase